MTHTYTIFDLLPKWGFLVVSGAARSSRSDFQHFSPAFALARARSQPRKGCKAIFFNLRSAESCINNAIKTRHKFRMKLNNAQFADALPRERDRAYNFKAATPGQRSATGCHRNKFHDSQFIRNKKSSISIFCTAPAGDSTWILNYTLQKVGNFTKVAAESAIQVILRDDLMESCAQWHGEWWTVNRLC